jgi:hypothetical protein
MSAQGVRIVVGEGLSTRQGLLRFVLDGEGYDVVAEASTAAELARLIAVHHPEVVVLDDGIGATAVGMINELSPDTNVVLVWPGAVMPVGGAARVEPHRVLQDLGTTVERLTGQRSATGSGHGPTLLERAANDPDLLRAMLLGGMIASDEPIIEDRENAPVVILPLTPTIDHDELILDVPEPEPNDERSGVATGVTAGVAGAAVLANAMPAAAEEAGSTGATVTSIAARGTSVGAQSALNRHLGNMALGGAAVASALVLALALGGARVPIEGISGQAPPAISSPSPGPTFSPPSPSGQPGNDGGGPPEGGNPNDAAGRKAATTPATLLVGNASPAPAGPPDVDIDPGDIGSGGGGGGGDDGGGGSGGSTGSDGAGGGDDHNGGDAGGDHTDGGDRGGGDAEGDGDDEGDHDRGGGNDGDGGDHDNGGGNDGDGGDHDKGGGNDDPDNPGHGGGGGSHGNGH